MHIYENAGEKQFRVELQIESWPAIPHHALARFNLPQSVTPPTTNSVATVTPSKSLYFNRHYSFSDPRHELHRQSSPLSESSRSAFRTKRLFSSSMRPIRTTATRYMPRIPRSITWHWNRCQEPSSRELYINRTGNIWNKTKTNTPSKGLAWPRYFLAY